MRSFIMPTHIVQELNVGTVYNINARRRSSILKLFESFSILRYTKSVSIRSRPMLVTILGMISFYHEITKLNALTIKWDSHIRENYSTVSSSQCRHVMVIGMQ